MRILIAEDDFTSRTILVGILERYGHEAVITCDGSEAWEAAQKPDAPHLAILDWMMPGMDGLDVCRKIRAAGGMYTYIIMLTAKEQADDVQSGFVAGADDYLIKPLDSDQLRHRLKVAERILAYEQQLQESRKQLEIYARNMESLAEERARQLAHADRMATLGTLAAGIAHEINNPTTFISGNAQTMQRSWSIVHEKLVAATAESSDPQVNFVLEEFPEMLADIRKGVDRISSIVSGLKSYARLETGRKAPFVLADSVQEALGLCHSVLKYNITVENDVGDKLQPVYGDKQKIEQVLVNLFVNAAQAMNENAGKRGRLHIFAREKTNHLLITVKDNGPGVPDELAERIFDPFFTTKKTGIGTGLGLSITKGIIEEHGGELLLVNSPEGATFSFSLPLAESVKEIHNE